uniref:transmembrane protein 26-like n=1 Tax=Ciona intestinalis TaxID=7719 RepID=UPI0002B8E616|nr:transmembrane protein 26-like [Ciona intestinalis]|eukprot:XP_004227132.1 transmembrane protein 26-like [Ciona intestinalis]
MGKVLDKCKRIALRPVIALVVRVIFALHCVVSAWRVVIAYNNTLYWLLVLLLIGLCIETVVTLILNGGQEWKWFSPGIFCYLVAAIPSLWLLELQLNNERLSVLLRNNGTAIASSQVLGIGVQISLDLSGWALAMEQSLLFILIIGRWVLPKGKISRNQLSQLLLVYLGMAADIMELFEVFKEKEVIQAQHLIYPILILYTWSLMQYTLAITSVKSRKPRGDISDDVSHYETSGCCKRRCGCDSVNADVLGIMSTIVMQDGPFLCFRLYLLVGLNVVSQMMVFFTCKNLLVLLLQIYRLITIYLDPDEDDDDVIRDDVGVDDITSDGLRSRPDGDNMAENGAFPDLRKRQNRISPTPDMSSQRPETDAEIELPHSVDFESSDDDDVAPTRREKPFDQIEPKRQDD